MGNYKLECGEEKERLAASAGWEWERERPKEGRDGLAGLTLFRQDKVADQRPQPA